MTLSEMRVHYDRGRLEREDLRDDPIEQFNHWLREACEAALVEPNAMILGTVDPEGRPAARTVLLKGVSREGFVFFTNTESRKARHIAGQPHVSLLFPWLALQRQVEVRGVAHRLPTAEVVAYFLTRPFGSQLAAWASPQSQVISARSVLEMKWEEAKRKFRAGQVPLPSFWGGYRVEPLQVEFWQGRANRLHDRFLYTRQEDGTWRIERLAP
ncbi:MAG TPA: pyridoxamine 5'-phosphate oxidase [Methylomirabilota bacterium]|nr:pyridoxamine 5'-phosphate oxidase [Methylomirabilota bacterium]